jgi:hypothetical protein
MTKKSSRGARGTKGALQVGRHRTCVRRQVEAEAASLVPAISADAAAVALADRGEKERLPRRGSLAPEATPRHDMTSLRPLPALLALAGPPGPDPGHRLLWHLDGHVRFCLGHGYHCLFRVSR